MTLSLQQIEDLKTVLAEYWLRLSTEQTQAFVARHPKVAAEMVEFGANDTAVRDLIGETILLDLGMKRSWPTYGDSCRNPATGAQFWAEYKERVKTAGYELYRRRGVSARFYGEVT